MYLKVGMIILSDICINGINIFCLFCHAIKKLKNIQFIHVKRKKNMQKPNIKSHIIS